MKVWKDIILPILKGKKVKTQFTCGDFTIHLTALPGATLDELKYAQMKDALKDALTNYYENRSN